MKIAELCRVLEHLGRLYATAGAKVPAGDIKALAEALEPNAALSVGDFVLRANKGLNATGGRPKGRKKPAAAKTVAEPNPQIVARYVEELRRAGTQRPAFDEAIEKLKGDPLLRLADLSSIAQRYADSVTAYKTASAAHKALVQAFVRQARFENKLR